MSLPSIKEIHPFLAQTTGTISIAHLNITAITDYVVIFDNGIGTVDYNTKTVNDFDITVTGTAVDVYVCQLTPSGWDPQ